MRRRNKWFFFGSRVNSSPPVKIPDYVRVHELAKPYRKLMFWIQFDDIVTGRPAPYDYGQEGQVLLTLRGSDWPSG